MAVASRWLCLALALSASSAWGCAGWRASEAEGFLGPLAADVRAEAAWLWARAPGPGEVSFVLTAPERRALGTVVVTEDDDWTAAIHVRGLRPATAYRYEVRHGARSRAGAFRTAPLATSPAPVRVAFGGDLAGQNVCRDAERGFPIFHAIAARRPDLFIGLGDMIYADDPCVATGRYGNAQLPAFGAPASSVAEFREHWRYAHADPAFARLLAQTSYAAVWDDHEVVNDFGAAEARLPNGLRAFREYNPIDAEGGHPPRLHRSLRWGRHLELFLLDTRQHRDPNTQPDSATKTLLGRRQREWLIHALRSSDARWKIVVSSVPLSIPTGADDTRRDGWSGVAGETGFEHELRTLLDALGPEAVRSLVWITTDVHFAEVLRYRPFAPRHDASMLEGVVGPLHAGLFPRRDLDDTLHPEVLFFHGPESADAVGDFDDALRWFNFGELEVDEAGSLTLRVLGVDGEALFEQRLEARSR